MKKIIAIASGAILGVALLVAFLPVGVSAQEGAKPQGTIAEEYPGDHDQLRIHNCSLDDETGPVSVSQHHRGCSTSRGVGLANAKEAIPYGTCAYGWENSLNRIYQNRMARLDRALERLQENPEQNAEAIARLEQARMMLEERYQEIKQWLVQKEWQTTTGTINAVNTEDHSLSIETPAGPLSLALYPSTIIFKDGERVFYDELVSGDYVTCACYVLTDDGQNALLAITVKVR